MLTLPLRTVPWRTSSGPRFFTEHISSFFCSCVFGVSADSKTTQPRHHAKPTNKALYGIGLLGQDKQIERCHLGTYDFIATTASYLIDFFNTKRDYGSISFGPICLWFAIFENALRVSPKRINPWELKVVEAKCGVTPGHPGLYCTTASYLPEQKLFLHLIFKGKKTAVQFCLGIWM